MSRSVRPRYVPLPYQDSVESGRLILRDGSSAHVRVARGEDSAAVQAFFERLSPEARQRRFFTASGPGPGLGAALCEPSDPRDCLSLIVLRTAAGEPRVVAVGSYHARAPGVAEVALAVDDTLRGKGLGTLLLERLALLAVRHGFTRFWAVTHADNRPMIDVARESGFPVVERADGSEVDFELAVVPTAVSVERVETRDRVATVASLVPFFRPRAVVVVGVSRDPSAIGRRIFDGLSRDGFTGPVYAVNRRAESIGEVRAYASVRELPEAAELAVIAVPRDAVPGVVDDCAARGVRALVVITAGFAEVGPEGAELQARLVERVRGHGMRMVGPNCLGLINADPAVKLNASFSPLFPPPGRVALSSQSGAVGLAVLAAAGRHGLGLSTFVSVGNKADVSGNDLLQYWEEDAGTAVILLYLESFGNPRRFARIARRVGRRKPVVVLKSGWGKAGRRAAGSHTAALAAGPTAVEALYRQTGIVRAETLAEMFDLARTLESQPLPRGRRVGIVTNSGGPAILCTDACEAGGLAVPEFSPGLRARLAELMPGSASTGNPVDLIASAGSEGYRRSVETILTSGEVDALVLIYTLVGLASTEAVRDAVGEAVAAARAAGVADVPVLACILADPEMPTHIDSGAEKIPCFEFPEAPGRVLGKIAHYADWRGSPEGVVPDFEDIDLPRAREICRKALAEFGPGWLPAEAARDLLLAAGLRVPPTSVARTADEAVRLADEIGYPVAVKLASRTLVHKTEVGGVRLNLADADAVRAAFDTISGRLEAAGKLDAMDGVVVQPMLGGGVEVMAGVSQDPNFGPLVAFGLGGIFVEVLADVVFRVAPLTDRDAAEMVREIRGVKLLQGYRGRPAADVEAIEEVLLRVARLAEEVPEIGEIDLNPIIALPPGEGCRVIDARVHVRNGSSQ